MAGPVVFLDKDGTLVEDVPYNVDPEHIRLAPGAERAIRLFAQHNCTLIVVTNQSGIARGLFPESAMDGVRMCLAGMLSSLGTSLAGFYYCPHHPEGVVPELACVCECRKPSSAMFYRAADDLGVSLRDAWMVGDILDDIEAGHRAGCRTILVDNGHETEWRLAPERTPTARVPDLEAAARVIVGTSTPRSQGGRADLLASAVKVVNA